MINSIWTLAALVSFLILGDGSSVVWAQGYSRQIPYDPSKCSTDAHDMVYFAVGQRVFRQPRPNLGYIAGPHLDEFATLPRPPKPDDPEGCPDHPIQGIAYTLHRVSAMPREPINPDSGYADSVRWVVNGGKTPNSADGTFDLFCKKFAPRDNDIPGFAGCKKPYRCDDVAYQAIDYRSPDGGRITMVCLRDIGCASSLAACNGGYRLDDSFVVNFSFSTARLPVEHFIAADREMRRRIDAAEVKNYPWALTPLGATPGETQ